MLDRLYKEFDDILRRQGMYCVDIIGDAYMAVAGLLGESALDQVCGGNGDGTHGGSRVFNFRRGGGGGGGQWRPQNWGGGVGKGAPLTGQLINCYELWRRRRRKLF